MWCNKIKWYPVGIESKPHWLQTPQNRAELGRRKRFCVFASLCPRHESILTTRNAKTRRRATAERDAITNDSMGHRCKILSHWRQ